MNNSKRHGGFEGFVLMDYAHPITFSGLSGKCSSTYVQLDTRNILPDRVHRQGKKWAKQLNGITFDTLEEGMACSWFRNSLPSR